MTPADERRESMDVMRGIGNGVMGGLVIASIPLLVVAWLTWGAASLVVAAGLVLAASVWHECASKRGEGGE